MNMTIPAAVKTAGTRRGVFIPGGVEDLTKITKAEITSGDNISCYLTNVNATSEQTMIQDRRYCSSQVFEIPGEETNTLEITYTFNLGSPGDDEARLAMVRGTKGTFVRFLQKDDRDDDFDTGDWYDAVNVECTKQRVVEGEENALDRIVQRLAIQSEWADWKQIVAA